MNLQDLCTAMFIWEGDLHMNLQAAWSKKGVIDHVLSISHANEQNVVELVHAIKLRKQLIDNTVANTSPTTSTTTSLLANSVQFVEDDYVQARLISLFL